MPAGDKRKQWQTNYAFVIEFAKKNGHIRIPHVDVEHRRCAQWLQKQRYRKKISHQDKTQLKVLEQYGFSFKWNRNDVRKHRWEAYFGQLMEFHEMNGHLKIPKCKAEYRALYWWVQEQRKAFWKNALSQDRRDKLLSVKFPLMVCAAYKKSTDFDKDNAKPWGDWFMELCDYFKLHKHVCVPNDQPKYTKLAFWVNRQRLLHYCGMLDHTHKKKLDTLGFEWDLSTTKSSESEDSSIVHV
jgi:hypothetical protein